MPKLVYPADYLGIYLTDLNRIFSYGRHVDVDDQSDVRFETAQGTLLL